MSIEDKPSGSLILDGDVDSERDSVVKGFGGKCRTAKERSIDFSDPHNQRQALIMGMGEGLERSDTIVKKTSDVDLELQELANEQMAVNNELISTV